MPLMHAILFYPFHLDNLSQHLKGALMTKAEKVSFKGKSYEC